MLEASLAQAHEHEAHLSAQLQTDAHRQAEEIAALTSRCRLLEGECERLSGALGSHDTARREESTHLTTQLEALQARFGAIETERNGLQEQVESLVALRDR